MTEQLSPADERRPNSEILRDLVQTFSDEAQNAAKNRATE